MAAKAELDDAQANLARLQPLIASHAIAPQDVDKAEATRDTDEPSTNWRSCKSSTARSPAPATGYVGRKNVEVGNRISSGQTLMDVVEPDM